MESKLFDSRGFFKPELRNELLSNGLSSERIDRLISLAKDRVELMALEHVLMWEVHDKILDALMCQGDALSDM